MNAVVDRVLERWRASGSIDHAVAALTGVATAAESGGVHRPQLARAVASEVAPAHPREHDVQLAAGRMLLAHRELDLAKRHLLLAAKLAPGTPSAPHLLGEALLLQGDAERAARALNAALKAGSDDEACRNWYRAALAYIPFQRRDGPAAVAAKVNAGMGGGAPPERADEPEEIVDEDSFDSEPPTRVARVAALPQMPSMPAPQATASMFPAGLEPAEEVPRDEATAIVSMDELRAMIEEDLREAEERGADDDDDFLGDTAIRHVGDEDGPTKLVSPPKLPPDRARRAAARPIPAIAESTKTTAEPATARAAKVAAPAPTERMFPAPTKTSELPVAPAVPPTGATAPAAVPATRAKPVALESAPVVMALAPVADSTAPAEVADPEPEPPPAKKKRRSNTPVVVALLLALVGVLLFGVRTGRLPALAKHLPAWVTGEAPLPFP